METKQPSIGDRVFFFYGAMCGEATGKVIDAHEDRWGKSWTVQMDDEPSRIETINRYVGTAEDRGGYCVALQAAGIGVYLVEPKALMTFTETVTALCNRVYPKRPTRAQARDILVETGTPEPSNRMIEALRDEADDQIDEWFRDASRSAPCESEEERDYI
jgi:hypothetical protein